MELFPSTEHCTGRQSELVNRDILSTSDRPQIKVLLIDNNDSFTYNIVDALRKIKGITLDVVLAGNLKVKDFDDYDRMIISPGPGLPSDFPILEAAIAHCVREVKPLLGVCLGHQAICQYFGGDLRQLDTVIHGQQETINIDPTTEKYEGLPPQIKVGLYHSWYIDYTTLPECLQATGLTSANRLMSVVHRDYNIQGIQYHPESFLTPEGDQILRNFLNVPVWIEQLS